MATLLTRDHDDPLRLTWPSTVEAVAASDVNVPTWVMGSRVLLTENLAHPPLAAWFVLRAFGRNGKTGLFSTISVICSERSEAR
jgi:hypothetical protein